ncbi:hypothetical protein ACFS07_00475 [Undibacterium arcticum]
MRRHASVCTTLLQFHAKCVAHEGGTDGEVRSDNDYVIDDSAHVVVAPRTPG